MALVKCKECGKEMSDHAKACPNCGATNDKMFCPECGKELSSKAPLCPNCGYSFKTDVVSQNSKGEMYGLSIAAFVCSFFFFFCIVGFIMGIVVLSANKGRKCTARNFAIAAVAISSAWFALFLLILFIGILSSELRVYF